ncbi:MAG: DUF4886 domain-containing protein [Clostridia bacterium]|nr:DUF4886 domain-containing protein [Clostridia bacterium]
MKKLLFLITVLALIFTLVSCGEDGDSKPNTPPHEHEFVEGKCECGESDPDYVPPHEHVFVDGKCECGEADPDYVPPHEHVFVDGKCECGEADPDYIPPVTEKKGIKILFFGNSYSVDATKWLSKIFLEAGYTDVVIGNVATGGCCINEHWSFLDGIEGNEPNNGSFFYTKYVNGSEVSTPDDYAYAIADEDWEIISIQHAPDELKQIDTYSHLQDFLDYIFARTTNEDVKLVFHMIWAHNNTSDTKGLYNSILQITDTYVTSNSAFDGLIPSATMIQYLRDHGLTDATKDDAGNWTAGDITRDWGHMNYGLGRYAIGLLYYAYLTGESVDDITWVPTPDMVAGTSEATGFAEIDAEKLALIKEAIKYALANPYGEDYTPTNGDGIGFPDCEMGGGNSGKNPLTPDENGVISFEDMTAEGSLLIIPTIAGTATVVDHGGSKQLEMKYTADSTEKFKFTPTLKESGADEMIFEADLTDSFGKPRTFTIYAGTTKVYDFRINGSGGFAAEGNNVWWGGSKYTLDTPYKFKITAKVTDGKLDLNLYINDTLVTRPSAYGTYLDITAADNLIELITHIEIVDGTTIASASAGSVYADNLKFVLLNTVDGGDEPEHEHVFVDGKCECGESDPDYVAPHEHVFVDGKCECGETDPDYVPEETKPIAPDANGVISFEGMNAESNPYIVPTTSGTVAVVDHGGSKQLEMKYTSTATEKFKFTPTLKESGADEMIFEASVTDSFGAPRTLKIYAGSRLVYDFRINGSGGFGAESNNSWWGSGHYTKDTQFKIKITVKVTDGKIDLNLYINDNIVTRPTSATTGYGVNLDLSCEADLVESITYVEITDGAASTVGSVYVDNYKFVLLNTSADEGGSGDGGDEPEHEHVFVDGKCECGESDPDYVAPHEHVFVDGKCECGETDPDYVAPSTPDIRDGAITFEDIESLGAVGVSVSNEEAIVVSPLAGGKALKVDFAAGATEKITITPNTVEGADKFVFEFDITNMDAADTVSTDKAQYDIKFYSLGSPEAANGTLYDFRLNGATFMCEGGNQWLGGILPADDTTFRLTIELWVEGEALCMNVLVDGNEVPRKSDVYGKSYTHVASGMSASTISSIYKVEIVDSRGTANGTVYFDNIYCAAIKSAE